MTIEIADRLCAYRKKNGLSQEELAERIGVSRQAVSKWERAEASPDTDNLILLSKIYGVTLDELLNTDPTEESEPEKKESVSFKNGIHVDAKNGDKVHIDFSGIHVEDHNGEKVHIDYSGINVEELAKKDGHIHFNQDAFSDPAIAAKRKQLHSFPFAIICCIAFLLIGFFNVLGGWSCGWLVFLLIPIYYSLCDAILVRNPALFCYPVLTALCFLACGLYMGFWHPTWIVFVTIPLYYAMCSFVKNKKAN